MPDQLFFLWCLIPWRRKIFCARTGRRSSFNTGLRGLLVVGSLMILVVRWPPQSNSVPCLQLHSQIRSLMMRICCEVAASKSRPGSLDWHCGWQKHSSQKLGLHILMFGSMLKWQLQICRFAVLRLVRILQRRLCDGHGKWSRQTSRNLCVGWLWSGHESPGHHY